MNAAMAMNKAAGKGLEVMQNRWFWIAVAIIVAYFIFRNPIRRAWQRLTAVDRGDYTGAGAVLSDADKQRLRQLAMDLHSAIEGSGFLSRERVMSQALALSDTMLRFLAQEYAANGANSLYQDIDDEWMPGTDVDERLMQRLRAISMI